MDKSEKLALHDSLKNNKFREDVELYASYAKGYVVQFRKLLDVCSKEMWESDNMQIKKLIYTTSFYHNIYRDLHQLEHYIKDIVGYRAKRFVERLLSHLDMALGTLHAYIDTGCVDTYVLFPIAWDSNFQRYVWNGETYVKVD